MRTCPFRSFALPLVCFIMLLFTSSTNAQSSIWATAYYAGWQQGYNNTGYLPAQNIDYTAMTHIVHFTLVPRSDGTLDDASNSVTAYNANQLITLAHAAGKKVIISVGGWATDVSFRGATSSGTRTTFVSNLVNLMKSRGYDGIDVDWETLASSDASQYVAFITDLRAALDAISPRPLLTAATAWQPSILAQVKDKFDQINIMSYDLSGAWPGWVTWHNAPISDGGVTFPSTGGAVPSIDAMVNSFIAAGIPAGKIGIGIDFYGYVWSGGAGTPAGGATAPAQNWTTAPSVQSNVPYYTIMSNYYQTQYYRWDSNAQASYLSIDNSGSTNDKFISYDDESTILNKVAYSKSKKIGGLIIWELGGGYRANQPAGQRDLLLQALKQALGGSTITPDATPPSISLTAPANGASVSGAVSVTANASDNVGVVGVQLIVDGMNLGNEITLAPYSATWNTSQVANGSHNIVARARDAAGNSSTSSVTLTVSNSTLPSSADLLIYQDALQSPWIDASWSATVTFSSTDRAYGGATSVKTALTSAWGGLSIHYGNWNSSPGINTSSYKSLDFAIYAPAAGTQISVLAENDQAQSFPPVNFTSIAANQWVLISVPITQLNPNNQAIHRLDIQKISGTTKTFYVDNLRFAGTGVAAPPPAPSLAGPANGAVNVATGPSLTWYASAGAVSYRVQVSTSSAFSTSAVDQSNITQTSFAASGLSKNTTYYWRANATNSGGTSAWSSTFSFATVAASDTTAPTVAITAPTNGSSVSGTVTITANATDNVKVAGVQFQLDGTSLGSESTAAPYTFVWATSQATNGAHTLSAVARDSAGNKSTASVSITVSNTATPAASNLSVYQDSLLSPWIDASWSATITYGSSEQAFAGSHSIKVAQNAWGALRVHSGAWGTNASVNTSKYSSLDFEIFGGTNGISMGLYFENDLGQPFPAIQYVWIPANQWTKVSYSISKLNPNNQAVDRVVIQDMTGRIRTFFVDDLRFTAATAALAKGSGEETTASPEANLTPSTFDLAQNYPNPFNPSTTISYAVAELSHVRLEIFNTIGQSVGVLVDRELAAGQHQVQFNALTLPSGVYFYRLTAKPIAGENSQPFVSLKRMVLMK